MATGGSEAVSEGCVLRVVATHLVGLPLLGLPLHAPLSAVATEVAMSVTAEHLGRTKANTAGDGHCFPRKQTWKTCKVCVCLENIGKTCRLFPTEKHNIIILLVCI